MLIIDMPMPKRCLDCQMHDWTFGRQNVLVCNARHELETFLCREIPNGYERPDWCPIKGVLPDEHGDLIDRDVLYMAVKSHNTSDAAIARNHDRVTSLQNLSTIRKGYIAEKHICLDDIIRAEAVIKAERRDDGTN